MRWLVAVMIGVFLSGCASSGKAVLRIGSPQAQTAAPILFPPDSDEEVPRYVFLGELTGERNFVVPENPEEGLFIRMLKVLAGWFEQDAPVVLQRPLSGVVDEAGRIFVTDVSRGAVYVFDETQGRLDVWEYAQGYRRFMSPTGIALGPDGHVFVADADLRSVVMLNRNGEGSGVIGTSELLRPTGLAWDADESLLYVADTQAHQIKVFDVTGRLVKRIGQRGEGPGEFNYPTHLALSQAGLVVSDSMNARIQVLPLSGKGRPRMIGQRGGRLGDFVRPKGVAVDSEQNIYALESYHDHLLVFDSQGRFLLPIGGTGKGIGSFYLPNGVWTDERNRI
ncbi:MAG: 6-bladed beta-propeller, partial [Nitrospirae bacterium]|nr:6-bladed beta-propeller [Nitrospirota bacterium]